MSSFYLMVLVIIDCSIVRLLFFYCLKSKWIYHISSKITRSTSRGREGRGCFKRHSLLYLIVTINESPFIVLFGGQVNLERHFSYAPLFNSYNLSESVFSSPFYGCRRVY